MSTHSAIKAHRQSVKRGLRNHAARSAVKTAVKKADAAIASSSAEEAGLAMKLAASVLDRAATKGILHPNNASRRKSRLVLRLNSVLATQGKQAKAKKVSKGTKAKSRRKKSES